MTDETHKRPWRKNLRSIQLWLTPAEHKALKRAAKKARRPMTHVALAAIRNRVGVPDPE